MEITLKTGNYGFDLIVKAENVNILEDIQERIWENNSIVRRDIKDEWVENIAQLMEDIIYYRVADFDSSSLIEQLFNKLPQETAEKLTDKLFKDYGTEED